MNKTTPKHVAKEHLKQQDAREFKKCNNNTRAQFKDKSLDNVPCTDSEKRNTRNEAEKHHQKHQELSLGAFNMNKTKHDKQCQNKQDQQNRIVTLLLWCPNSVEAAFVEDMVVISLVFPEGCASERDHDCQ